MDNKTSFHSNRKFALKAKQKTNKKQNKTKQKYNKKQKQNKKREKEKQNNLKISTLGEKKKRLILDVVYIS